PSAFATDYCVVPATACTAPNTLPSVQGALTTAVFHPGDDRVLLGAATYSNASGFQYSGSPGNSVELIGAGPGTTLTSTDLAGTTLAFGSGTVRDLSLTATHAQGATGHVLALHSAVADHVTASGSGRGVELSGAKLAH